MADVLPARGPWRKSSRSGVNGECLEIAEFGDTIAIRDSKHPAGPILRFERAQWNAFMNSVKSGHFDRPGSID